MYAQDKCLKKQLLCDTLFRGSTRFFAFLVFILLAAIIATLIGGSLPTLKKFGLQFIFSSEWNPVTEEFSALNSLLGTVISSLIALFIAVPISFGIALFLTELSPSWLRRPLGMAIELLAGIPSIIYGMWGLFVFAPFFADYIQPTLTKYAEPIPLIGGLFQGPPIGVGLLTAGIILSIMIIPFISSVMRDVFAVVPAMLKESAYGLGCTTWEVMWHIVLPFTRNGVIGGIMLGLGRALGETMAVTFVIGNSHSKIHSLFDPATSIAATLANEFTEATGLLHLSALIELGLLLFVITLIVLILSKLLLLRLAKSDGAHA
jgi:phosphate transport system permease protein